MKKLMMGLMFVAALGLISCATNKKNNELDADMAFAKPKPISGPASSSAAQMISPMTH